MSQALGSEGLAEEFVVIYCIMSETSYRKGQVGTGNEGPRAQEGPLGQSPMHEDDVTNFTTIYSHSLCGFHSISSLSF